MAACLLQAAAPLAQKRAGGRLGVNPALSPARPPALQPAPGWRIISLDGYDVSILGWPPGERRAPLPGGGPRQTAPAQRAARPAAAAGQPHVACLTPRPGLPHACPHAQGTRCMSRRARCWMPTTRTKTKTRRRGWWAWRAGAPRSCPPPFAAPHVLAAVRRGVRAPSLLLGSNPVISMCVSL